MATLIATRLKSTSTGSWRSYMRTPNSKIRSANWNGSSINPWQKWIHAAKTIDAWRLFPRAFISVYMVLLYYSTMWFMELESPDLAQAGLISTVVGAGAAWFGLYTRSQRRW